MDKKLKYSILALVVSLVFLGGFFILKNKDNKKEEVVLNQIATSSEEKTAILIDDIDINDWLVYKNEEYGFEVKYPREWKIEKEQNLTILNSEDTYKKLNTENLNELIGNDIDIKYYNSIEDEPENIANKLGAKNLNEFIERNIFISNRKKIKLNDRDAWSVIIGGYGTYYTVFIENNKHIYEIMFNNKENEKDLTEIEKSILNSFKFIN